MRLVFLTLFRPREAALQIAARPRWLGAFLFLSVLSVIISAAGYPHFVQEMLTRLPPSASKEDKEFLVTSLSRELPARLAFLPIRLFLGWGSFALLLFYLAKMFEPKEVIQFRQMLALEVHSEAIGVAAGIVVTGLLISGIGGISLSLADVWNGPLLQETMLRQVSLAALWQILVQGVALSHLCGFGKLRGFLVVALTWAITASLNIGAVQIIIDQFHIH